MRPVDGGINNRRNTREGVADSNRPASVTAGRVDESVLGNTVTIEFILKNTNYPTRIRNFDSRINNGQRGFHCISFDVQVNYY